MAVKNVKRVRCGCPHGVRSLGALLLIFVLLFSFPFSASAQNVTKLFAYGVRDQYGGDLEDNFHLSTGDTGSYSLPVGATVNKSGYNKVRILTNFDIGNIKLNKGDRLEFNITYYANSRYDYIQMIGQLCPWGDPNYIIGSVKINEQSINFNQSTGVLSFYIDCDKTFNGSEHLSLVADVLFSSSVTSNIYYKVTSCDYNIVDVEQAEHKGLLNTILEWLRTIKERLDSTFQNISDGFSNIGTWLSEKFSSLNTWLTDIKNNVTNSFSTWFNNLSTWITNLKQGIGEFFTNIWNSINTAWENFKTWLHDLFIPSDEFLTYYKNQWNDWLNYHFGGVFDAFTYIQELFNTIGNLLDFSQPEDFSITIPSMSVQTYGGEVNFRLLNSHTFSFNELIDLYGWFGVDWFGSWITIKSYIDMAVNALFFLFGIYQIKALWLEFLEKRSGEL